MNKIENTKRKENHGDRKSDANSFSTNETTQTELDIAYPFHLITRYSTMSIFILSDIHIDYQSNWKWILNLSDHDFKKDTLILVGDVTDQMTRLAVALETLNQKFKHVFYVLGNHELWLTLPCLKARDS